MRADSRDSGFSVIELVVAMAVFGVLMVIVGSAVLSLSSSVTAMTDRTDDQADARLAAEWTGRLLRFADVPEGQSSAIAEASPTSITFFTFSGTGAKHDVPYRCRIYTVTAGGTRSLRTDIWTPTGVAGGWTWSGAPQTRTLMTLPGSAQGPLRVEVWVRNPGATPPAAARVATPPVSGPLVLQPGEIPDSVVLEIGDRRELSNVVAQQVRLENLV